MDSKLYTNLGTVTWKNATVSGPAGMVVTVVAIVATVMIVKAWFKLQEARIKHKQEKQETE